MISSADIAAFVIRAKAACYVGDGSHLLPYRLGAIDLQYQDGPFVYHDSYFGDSDFLGQEVVYHERRPVWGMSYHGYLLEPSRINAATAGRVLKIALAELYRQGRFLGGWTQQVEDLTYVDESVGGPDRFRGGEHIQDSTGRRLYELCYHGGLIR